MNTYLNDIEKYDAAPDAKAAEKLASDLRLVMQDTDARYVAIGDPAELEIVVKNFAIDKLGAAAEAAQEAVNAVAQLMSGSAKKNRVTFYYLVAKQLGSLGKLYL